MTVMIPFKKNTDKENFLNKFFGDEFVNDFVHRPISMLSGEGYYGRVNVIENTDTYQLEVLVPGVTKENIEIKVANEKELIIKLDSEHTVEEEGKNFIRKEFATHKFERHFALPEDVTEDNIEAEFNDGVLTLTLKREVTPEPEEKVKNINIK